jgi:hypothetical protein
MRKTKIRNKSTFTFYIYIYNLHPQDNTAGVNCEQCVPDFYRPANVSHYRRDACRPCDCDPIGSRGSQCVRDETDSGDGLRPGDCRSVKKTNKNR